MALYEINLSTTEKNSVGLIKIRQDDNMTQKLIAKITENGKPKKVSGLVVFFNAMYKGRIIARDLAKITEDNSTVEYTLHPSFYSELGRIDAFFSFEMEGSRDSTANFSYVVVPGPCRKMRGSNYIYDFEELKGVAGEIIGSNDLDPLVVKDRELQAKIEGLDSDLKTELKNVENTLNDFSEDMSDFKDDVDEKLKETTDDINEKIDSDISDLREEMKRQEVKDSGWMDLELANGYRWHDLYPGKFRIIGKHVYLTGAIISKNEVFEETTVAKIPRAFAPNYRQAFTVAQMSSIPSEIANVAIWQNGEIQVVSSVSKEKNVFLNQVNYPLV